MLLLLLLLGRFSRVQLCATPEMVAHQAPPYLGFSRQEHWSGLPCPQAQEKPGKTLGLARGLLGGMQGALILLPPKCLETQAHQ